MHASWVRDFAPTLLLAAMVAGIWIWYRLLMRDRLTITDKIFLHGGVVVIYVLSICASAFLFHTPVWLSSSNP